MDNTEWDVDVAGPGTTTFWDVDVAGPGTRTIWDEGGAQQAARWRVDVLPSGRSVEVLAG